VGYGIDDPHNRDLAVTPRARNDPPVVALRTRNEVYWVNLLWDITRHLQCGFEVSYRETDYTSPHLGNSGLVYHFLSRLNY
jgi:hypothetical protein